MGVNQDPFQLPSPSYLDEPLTFTGRHAIPPATAMLPRPEATGRHAADNMVIYNLCRARFNPQDWERALGHTIDSAVRDFFGGLRLEQVCDPVGMGALPGEVLRAQLNDYLARSVGRQLGYQVYVRTIEIQEGSDQEMLALRRRMNALGSLYAQIAPLAPDQVLLANELLKDLTGRSTTSHVAVDLGGAFWAQSSAAVTPPPVLGQRPPLPTTPAAPSPSRAGDWRRRPPTPPLPPWDMDPDRPAA